MKKTWWILGAVVALSTVACDDSGDGDGTGDGNGTSTVCTGTYSGAVTGRVKFCSLEATKLANGQLQYVLQIDPEEGSGTVASSDSITFFVSGDPKTGTYSGTALQKAIGSVYSTDDNKQYSLQLGIGETLGSATLTIDSVPSGQDLGNGNTLYQWFGGKAQIQYQASATQNYTGTVDLTLNFKPQQ